MEAGGSKNVENVVNPTINVFFGETADCLFLGFTTLDVSNGFCGSGLVPAALPQLGLGQTRGSVADIGGIDQAHEGCVPLEGHAGAGEIECIFLKNLICIQFGLAILKVQKWLRQGCLRFCNRRRQISAFSWPAGTRVCWKVIKCFQSQKIDSS